MAARPRRLGKGGGGAVAAGSPLRAGVGESGPKLAEALPRAAMAPVRLAACVRVVCVCVCVGAWGGCIIARFFQGGFGAKRERERARACACWFGIQQGQGKGDRCLSRSWASSGYTTRLRSYSRSTQRRRGFLDLREGHGGHFRSRKWGEVRSWGAFFWH